MRLRDVFSGLLLLVVGVWWLVEHLQRLSEERRDTQRRQQILALRQRYVGVRPRDPIAQAMLGDALRQAGHAQAALAAYTEAEQLFAGDPARADLVNKKRLVALEVAEALQPSQFRQTLQTRESICRRCGGLNLPQLRECTHCGAALLVEGFWETAVKGGTMRGDLVRSLWPLVLKTALVLLAVACASFLPLEIRGAVLIATIIVVPIVTLRQLGNPSLGE